MPKKSSKKLETLAQATGKVPTYEITNIEQIFGGGEQAKFGTLDEAVFKAKLLEMTRADLENFARKHGGVIVENSDRIRAELLKIFRSYVSLLQKPISKPAAKITVSSDVQRILNEGR